MNIGQFFSAAGQADVGIRQAEEAARVARQNQLIVEEQNRVAGLRMPRYEPVSEALSFPAPFAVPQAMPEAPPEAAPTAAPTTAAPTTAAPTTAAPTAAAPTAAAPTPVPTAPPSGGLTPLTQSRYSTPFAIPEDQRKLIKQEEYNRTVADMEKYVQQLKQRDMERAAGTTPTIMPLTREAIQYDAKVTPYDTLIEQSAKQYGLDPVIFKRLLGTESSFNPTAVSPRGAKYGLGIAQISAEHGLTTKQRLDPNIAIPKGAEIFAQYLRESGNNYEKAIQRYKGASSEAGKTAMASTVNTILSGITPTINGVPVTGVMTHDGYAEPVLSGTPYIKAEGAPAATAPAEPPKPLEVPQNQARNIQMAEHYLAAPETIPYEVRQLNEIAQQQYALMARQRNETAQLLRVYQGSITAQGVNTYMRLRDSLYQIDAGMLQLKQQVAQKQMYLQGMQGLRELTTANDPRRLAGVLTQYMGVPVGIQPRPDGMYNYFVNGKKVQDGVTPKQLGIMALQEFSPEARQTTAESAKLENELALKLKYDPQRDTARFTAAANLQKAIIDGEYKIAEEHAKQLGGKLTLDTNKGIAYFQIHNRVFIINPEGKISETPTGKIELPPTARPVAGLDMGRK